ncbi:hypothetical protein ACFL08_00260 [Patescibacteria group bacterium]
MQSKCDHPRDSLYVEDGICGASFEMTCRECSSKIATSRKDTCPSCFNEMGQIKSGIEGEEKYACSACSYVYSDITHV